MAEKDSPFAGLEVSEKGARAVDRIKERFKISDVPAALSLAAGSEPGVNDVYMNLNRQLAEGKVSEKTKLIVAVAVASAVGSSKGVELFTDMAIAAGRTAQEALDATSVATVCSVFNAYYRWRDQVPADLLATYEAFRAPFNANTFMKCALTHQEVEAICVAVSSVNNCHKCVEGHLNKAKSLGYTDEQIDEILRASAIAYASANLLAALGGKA